MITTNRLDLIQMHRDMLEAIVDGNEAYFQDMGFTPNAKWFYTDIKKRANGFLSYLMVSDLMVSTTWMIVLRETKEIIGDIGFNGLPDQGSVEIGYSISKPFRRHHYAIEAIEGLSVYAFMTKALGQILKIEGVIDLKNQASLECIEKAGYRRVGHDDQHQYYVYEANEFLAQMRSLSPNMIMLTSSCLMGVNARYNALPFEVNTLDHIHELTNALTFVPVCPEQMGGLSTPRPPVERLKGQAVYINKLGENVTNAFVQGARETMKLAQYYQTRVFYLKQSSPTCGSTTIYDGTFSGHKISGKGCLVELIDNSMTTYLIIDEQNHMTFKMDI